MDNNGENNSPNNPEIGTPSGPNPTALKSDTKSLSPSSNQKQAQSRLLKILGAMAFGTTISRILGLVRLFALGSALGLGGAADAYNLANTTPNIIHDLVIGGVLAATFVPLFTRRLTTMDKESAWEGISAVVTVSSVVLILGTFLFELFVPLLVDAYSSGAGSKMSGATRQLAVDLLRLFVPQLAFYGFISIATALLNSVGKFGVITAAPIFNNIVTIFILIELGLVVHSPTPQDLLNNYHLIFLLGIGTSAGVAAQFLALVPSLIKANLPLKWNLNFKHEAVRAIVRLSSWTFGFVLANQLALFVILALAARSPLGTLTAYTYAYTFFQLPYWLVSVSISSALTPELSALAAIDDMPGFAKRFSLGVRSINAIIIPASIGYLVLAVPIVGTVLFHGSANLAGVQSTASTLSLMSLGLPGFCIFLLVNRAFFALHDAKTVFFLYVFENFVNVVAAFALISPMGARGIGLSLTIAYSMAAVVGLIVLRRKVGHLGGRTLFSQGTKVLILSLIMGLGAAGASSVLPTTTAFGDAVDAVLGVVVGVMLYLLLAAAIAPAKKSSKSKHKHVSR
ncbi:MAG: murein biosynthesis integral membrane protein MurJ [Acidimicrobiales bacterium]|nr:murein biosynthesis integral membrane protein MurJ [Acidimicrobiales bacterium]